MVISDMLRWFHEGSRNLMPGWNSACRSAFVLCIHADRGFADRSGWAQTDRRMAALPLSFRDHRAPVVLVRDLPITGAGAALSREEPNDIRTGAEISVSNTRRNHLAKDERDCEER